MLNSLPEEILTEIFVRLPVKTLLIIRSICKTWNTFITDNPNFTQFHLHSYKNNSENNLLLSRECNSWKNFMVVRDTNTFTKVSHLDATNYLKVGYVDNILKEQVVVPRTYEEIAYLSTDDCNLVGYVDGVLLIHTHNPCVNRGFNRILLWNPSIRKVFQVPPCNANAQNKTDINFGFGYDQVSNEYKVVAVDMKYCYSKTRVYRLGTDSWSFAKEKRSYPIIPKLFLKKFSSTTNFEGAIHWLGSDGRRRKSRYSHLLRFDLTTEAYTCIKLPDVEFKEYRKQPPKRFLSVLDRKLAILDIGVANVCIWVMENNGTTNGCSWTKQYNVDLRVQKFLYLKENGELLFYRKFQELLSYDFRNQQMKKLGRQSQQIIDFVDTYKESLVLLGGYI
ncbi:putative F-box protein At3g16210 [Spinacia oleracea]|uniref:F-box protein At3g16210 n=1 Tax=Spinacia oleracea TaxID=3562 RepID=A0A9R0JVB0_SPIOL|nr:putative F-box protein At3g16210 [Spinacia oleracea]